VSPDLRVSPDLLGKTEGSSEVREGGQAAVWEEVHTLSTAGTGEGATEWMQSLEQKEFHQKEKLRLQQKKTEVVPF
jgi:hypothetical protein